MLIGSTRRTFVKLLWRQQQTRAFFAGGVDRFPRVNNQFNDGAGHMSVRLALAFAPGPAQLAVWIRGNLGGMKLHESQVELQSLADQTFAYAGDILDGFHGG